MFLPQTPVNFLLHSVLGAGMYQPEDGSEVRIFTFKRVGHAAWTSDDCLGSCVDFLRFLLFDLGGWGSVGFIVFKSGSSRGLVLSCGGHSAVGLVWSRMRIVWMPRVLHSLGIISVQ